MGMTFSYKPSPPPTLEQLATMRQEAISCRPLSDWWSEPLNLFDTPELGIVGLTKVSLPGYSSEDGYVEVDPAEDSLMMWNDVTHIAAMLTKWSCDHGFGWEIGLEGSPLGTISASGPDATLADSLEELLGWSEAPKDPFARRSLIKSVGEKYRSRW